MQQNIYLIEDVLKGKFNPVDKAPEFSGRIYTMSYTAHQHETSCVNVHKKHIVVSGVIDEDFARHALEQAIRNYPSSFQHQPFLRFQGFDRFALEEGYSFV